MSVKKRSYLRGCRLRPAKLMPRDVDICDLRRRDGRGRGEPTASGSTRVRRRPHTAIGPRSALRFVDNPPLITPQEATFIYGEADEDANSRKPPSLRKTTLGRMLQRSASSTACTSSPQRRWMYVRSPSRRPVSAGACRSSRGRNTKSYDWKQSGPPEHHNVRRIDSSDLLHSRKRPPSAETRLGRESSPPQSVTTRCSRGRGSTTTADFSNTALKRKDGILEADPPAWKSGTTGDTRELKWEDERTRKSSRKAERNLDHALEATIKAAIGAVSPRGQFLNARKLITEMKSINTKDSTGDLLLGTQVCPDSVCIQPGITTLLFITWYSHTDVLDSPTRAHRGYLVVGFTK